MKKTTIVFLLLAVGLFMLSGCVSEKKSDAPFSFNYKAYADFLADHVGQGRVNYEKMKINKSQLEDLIETVTSVSLDKATSNEELAFYINTFNLLVFKSIVDVYPVNSVKDIKDMETRLWTINGQDVNLAYLRDEILRKKYDNPAILMTISNGTLDGPIIMDRPYHPDSIDIHLEYVTRMYVLFTDNNYINIPQKKAELSEYFKWYAEDFVAKYKTEEHFQNLNEKENAVLNFVTTYLPPGIRNATYNDEFRVVYRKFNWNLNKF